MDRNTRLQKIIHWFQNNKVFSWVAVAVLVVGGAGTVAGSIDTIVRFYNDYLGKSQHVRLPIEKGAIRAIPSPVSYGYLYDVLGGEVERLPGNPDYLDHPTDSLLLLYEDGQPLTKSHGSHDKIMESGGGLYSHWRDDRGQEYILFSASDNGDPRTNDHEYVLAAPGGERVEFDKQKIVPSRINNFGFRFRSEQLTASPANSDCAGNSHVSRLKVLETVNGRTRELGPAHSPRHEIEKYGEGRYNHCRDGTTVWLFFSASDNSDPRENGRDYLVTVSNE